MVTRPKIREDILKSVFPEKTEIELLKQVRDDFPTFWREFRTKPATPASRELIGELQGLFPEQFTPESVRAIPFPEEQVAPALEEPGVAPSLIPEEGITDTLVEDYARIYANYQRTGGKLGLEDWVSAGTPLIPDLEISIGEQEARVGKLITDVFPDMTPETFTTFITEDWQGFTDRMIAGGPTTENKALLREMGFIPEEIDNLFKPWFERLPAEGIDIEMEIAGVQVPVHIESPNLQVWADDILIGRFNVAGEFRPNPKGLSEYLTANYIEPPQASKDEINKDYKKLVIEIDKEFADVADWTVLGWKARRVANPERLQGWLDAQAKAWDDYIEALRPPWEKVWTAGTGDVISVAGGVTRWMGFDGIADRLTKFASELQAQAPPDYLGEFEWSMLLNPRFYSTRVLRALPFTLSLAPAAIIGAYIATHIPIVSPLITKHIGKYGELVLASIGGAALSRPLESAYEAGATYDDATARGMTRQEANKAALDVFLGNLVLGGWDAAQFAIAFIPIPGAPTASKFWKMAMVGGKLAIVGLTEAGEEAYQEVLQRWAVGDEVKLDAEMQQVMSIGGIFGIGLGGAGEVFTRIKDYTLENLTPEDRASFDGDITRFEADGLTREQAELKAFDELAKTEEGGLATSDAVERTKREGFDAEAARYREIIEAREAPEVPVTPEVPTVPERIAMPIEVQREQIIRGQAELDILPPAMIEPNSIIAVRNGYVGTDAQGKVALVIQVTQGEDGGLVAGNVVGREDVSKIAIGRLLKKAFPLLREAGIQVPTEGLSEEGARVAEKFLRPEVTKPPVEIVHRGTEPEGIAIADELGLQYDGIQEGLGMQFTDVAETGTTFYANTLEEARSNLTETRASFAKPPVEPPPTEVAPEPVPVSENAIEKLTRLVKDAEPARAETEALKHEELRKRVGRAAATLETAEGREAFQRSKAALRGVLPTADFAAPEGQMTDTEVKELYNIIKDSDIRYFEKLNTAEALGKLLLGQIPTRGELQLLENMFGQELASVILAKRTLSKKIWEATLDFLNIPRAVLSSWDLSAPLRQGALLFWGQPKQSFSALKPMLKAFASEELSLVIDTEIRTNKYADLREDAGLYIAPMFGVSASLSQREEVFMSRLAEKIPLVRRSERAYVTYLNKLRADVFDSYARQWEGMNKTMKDYKELATFINRASGRGNLGALRGSAPILSAVFFSPRYQASRIALPVGFVTATPAVRRVMARNIVAFISANFAILGLLKLAGAEVEDDPRSPDFGKVQFGNTRLDFWAGFQQYARAVAQMITEQRKTTTTGRLTETERAEVIGRFVRGKLSPVAGLVTDILEGETYIGEELTLEAKSLATQAFNRLVPMFIQDLVDAVNDSGIAGGLMAMPGLLGVGVQTYGGGYWEEFTDQLGQPAPVDTLSYSVDVEDIYTTKDFYSDATLRIRGVDIADLTPEHGFPNLVRAVAETRDIKKVYEERPSSALHKINADLAEGDTFELYYLQWQDYQKAEDKEQWLKDNKEYDKYYMGNFSHRELALLREYHALERDEQKAFLEEHPELAINPRIDWLKSHPEDNAKLAVWGQAKLYTMKAYTEAQSLIKELDIPDKALPDFTLPPEGSVENYFKYLEQGEDLGYNSWEVRLIVAQDNDLREFLGRQPIDTPIPVLELKIKHRDLFDEYETLETEENRQALKDANPEWVDDMRRIDAYENNASEDIVGKWVERGKVIDEFESGSSEAILWLVDNPDVYDWAVENELLKDNRADNRAREPILRIDVDYAKEDDWYNKGIPAKHAEVAYKNRAARDAGIATERERYLSEKPEYNKARYRRDAYGLRDKAFNPFPNELVDTYVDYYTNPTLVKPVDWEADWYEDDWFLQDNPEFHQALVDYGKFSDLRDLSKVPTREVFSSYQEYLGIEGNDISKTQAKLNFRHENLDLDDWLVETKGFKPVGTRWTVPHDPVLANKKYWLELAAHFKNLLKNLGIRLDITPEELTNEQMEEIKKAIRQLYD